MYLNYNKCHLKELCFELYFEFYQSSTGVSGQVNRISPDCVCRFVVAALYTDKSKGAILAPYKEPLLRN